MGAFSLGGAVGLAGMSTLGVPWLAGLTLRFRDRARESRASQVAAEEGAARAEVAAEQSREIAQLREDQARLARDVHDVVGHSLAVILAQAESAQYLAGHGHREAQADHGEHRHLGPRRRSRTCATC